MSPPTKRARTSAPPPLDLPVELPDSGRKGVSYNDMSSVKGANGWSDATGTVTVES